MNQTMTVAEEQSLIRSLLVHGLDATLNWLCTLFVFTDE